MSETEQKGEPEEKPARERRPREHHVPTGGIFLVFLGIVLLLQSLDVMPWSIWNTLWRFWPVLLIITGLNILLRRFNVWLVSLLLLVLLFVCLSLALWQQQPPLTPAGPNINANLLPSQVIGNP